MSKYFPKPKSFRPNVNKTDFDDKLKNLKKKVTWNERHTDVNTKLYDLEKS